MRPEVRISAKSAKRLLWHHPQALSILSSDVSTLQPPPASDTVCNGNRKRSSQARLQQPRTCHAWCKPPPTHSVGLSLLFSASLVFRERPTALCADGVVRFVSVSPAGQDRVCFEIPCVVAGQSGGSFAMDRLCNQLALVADGKVSLLPGCQAFVQDVG